MQIFFDDLELPRLARTEIGHTEQRRSIRAGYTKSGVPANLSVIRTLRQSLARRIALAGGIARRDGRARSRFLGRGRRRACRTRRGAPRGARALCGGGRKLPFLDEPDLRYRNRVWKPEPIARAVMFCLMDVSASMDEDKKDLAKRFFTLLYLFLTRKYGAVDLIFIRHTDDAEEVDEDTFFHDTRSGGTVVYSALELADRIRAERYARGWNVYAAQASDGDAFGADPARSARFLRERLLPATRYYTYLELAAARHAGSFVAPVGRVRTCGRGERQLRHALCDAARRDLSGVPRAVPEGGAMSAGRSVGAHQ